MWDLQVQHASLWDLIPWPEIEPRPPALGVWSLSHRTTREIPYLYSLHRGSNIWIGSWRYLYNLRESNRKQRIEGRGWLNDGSVWLEYGLYRKESWFVTLEDSWCQTLRELEYQAEKSGFIWWEMGKHWLKKKQNNFIEVVLTYDKLHISKCRFDKFWYVYTLMKPSPR